MRQQIDAHTQFLQRKDGFVNFNIHAGTMQIEGCGQSADSGAGNDRFLVLRMMDSPCTVIWL